MLPGDWQRAPIIHEPKNRALNSVLGRATPNAMSRNRRDKRIDEGLPFPVYLEIQKAEKPSVLVLKGLVF